MAIALVLAALYAAVLVVIGTRWTQLIIPVLCGFVPVFMRLWWDGQSGPRLVRGSLLLPKSSWLEDDRCTIELNHESIEIRRWSTSESWTIPWVAIDSLELERRRRSMLTLILDGTPLAQVRTGVNDAGMASRLRAAGLDVEGSDRP
jgi:hypothetical protein